MRCVVVEIWMWTTSFVVKRLSCFKNFEDTSLKNFYFQNPFCTWEKFHRSSSWFFANLFIPNLFWWRWCKQVWVMTLKSWVQTRDRQSPSWLLSKKSQKSRHFIILSLQHFDFNHSQKFLAHNLNRSSSSWNGFAQVSRKPKTRCWQTDSPRFRAGIHSFFFVLLT